MHLSIETPTPPPPPRAYVGQCGGFLWYLKAWLARGGGGFLRICLAYSWTSGSEVGIWLVPSFLTVISSRDHWYFDVYMLWSYLACWLWKVSFLIVFCSYLPFCSSKFVNKEVENSNEMLIKSVRELKRFPHLGGVFYQSICPSRVGVC